MPQTLIHGTLPAHDAFFVHRECNRKPRRLLERKVRFVGKFEDYSGADLAPLLAPWLFSKAINER